MINTQNTFLGPTNIFLATCCQFVLQKTLKNKQQIDYIMIVCNHEKPVDESIFNSYKSAPL